MVEKRIAHNKYFEPPLYPICPWCSQKFSSEFSLRDHQFNGGCEAMVKGLAARQVKDEAKEAL